MTPAEQRRAWAYRFIARVQTPPPEYGSPAWVALPDSDPRKVAAVVIAAEALVYDQSNWLERQRLEIEAGWRAHKAAEDAQFHARATEHRESWTGSGFAPGPRLAEEIAREWEQWAGGDAA